MRTVSDQTGRMQITRCLYGVVPPRLLHISSTRVFSIKIIDMIYIVNAVLESLINGIT